MLTSNCKWPPNLYPTSRKSLIRHKIFKLSYKIRHVYTPRVSTSGKRRRVPVLEQFSFVNIQTLHTECSHTEYVNPLFYAGLLTGARGTDLPPLLTFCLQIYFNPQALVARTCHLFLLTISLQIYFQLNFFISLLLHLFFLILTCSCQYSNCIYLLLPR
jgi:hypothetical protein